MVVLDQRINRGFAGAPPDSEHAKFPRELHEAFEDERRVIRALRRLLILG